MARAGGHRYRGRIQVAVYIRIVGGHVDHHRGIFGRDCYVRVRYRGVVYGQYRYRHDGGITQRGQRRTVVTHLVNESIRTVEIRVRRIGDGSRYGIHRYGSVSRLRTDGHRARHQRTVNIAVVQQYGNRHGCVFVGRSVVGVGNGWVVHGRYRNRHQGRVAQVRRAAVAYAVTEYVGAVIVGIRGVGIRSVSVKHQAAVGRAVYHRIGGAGTVRIAVVRRYVAAHGHILGRRIHVVHGHGRVVHRSYRYRYGSRIAQCGQRRTVVAHAVNKGIRSAEIRVRRIGNNTRHTVYTHRTVGGRSQYRQRIGIHHAVDVGIVGQYRNADGRIFLGSHRVGVRNRRVVHRRYRNCYRGRVAQVRRAAVAYAVAEYLGAVIVGVRGIGIGSVGVQY